MERDEHGQSMVEFALILPVLILLVAGIFDLGRAFYATITITNAAREGARYGTLNPDYGQGICNATTAEVGFLGMTVSPNDVTVSCINTVNCLNAVSWAGCADMDPLRVTVNYKYDDMILLGFFFPDGIPMTRYVEMLVP